MVVHPLWPAYKYLHMSQDNTQHLKVLKVHHKICINKVRKCFSAFLLLIHIVSWFRGQFHISPFQEVLGLRMSRWLGPSLVVLMIFQASWCMRPSREQPLIDKTSSPTSMSPDSSAAPPAAEEHSSLALLKDILLDSGGWSTDNLLR